MELILLTAPTPEEVGLHFQDFLKKLKGPTVIHLPGKDKSRTRVLVTLTHGNEYSGLEAIHRWLREGKTPWVNIVVILGGIEAAQREPLFFYRHLPNKRDLNRCFRAPYDDSQGKLAAAILQQIHQCRPEAVVDMHNTSGPNPAFAISYGHDPAKERLAGLFAETLIVSDLSLGSLMEQNFSGPVITVEVGGSEEPRSSLVAWQGLEKYFLKDKLFETPEKITTFYRPLRLELDGNRKVDYAQGPLKDCDVTIRSDIESLNFRSIGVDEFIGWVNTKKFSHLFVKSADTTCPARKHFSIREGKLYPNNPMTLLMATSRKDIAASDCLFYFCLQE